jgi:hypothetical protein
MKMISVDYAIDTASGLLRYACRNPAPSRPLGVDPGGRVRLEIRQPRRATSFVWRTPNTTAKTLEDLAIRRIFSATSRMRALVLASPDAPPNFDRIRGETLHDTAGFLLAAWHRQYVCRVPAISRELPAHKKARGWMG